MAVYQWQGPSLCSGINSCLHQFFALFYQAWSWMQSMSCLSIWSFRLFLLCSRHCRQYGAYMHCSKLFSGIEKLDEYLVVQDPCLGVHHVLWHLTQAVRTGIKTQKSVVPFFKIMRMALLEQALQPRILGDGILSSRDSFFGICLGSKLFHPAAAVSCPGSDDMAWDCIQLSLGWKIIEICT